MLFIYLDSTKRYQSQPSELSYNTITDPRNNNMHNKYINKFTNSLDASRMPMNGNQNQQVNQYNSHIPTNDYQNSNPNIFNPLSPRNNGYDMNMDINYQQNDSGQKLRRMASHMMN